MEREAGGGRVLFGCGSGKQRQPDDLLELLARLSLKNMYQGKSQPRKQGQHLPNDLLLGLLARLPLKNIYQWSCVSKFWFSIIRSPRFFQDYLSRSGLLMSVTEIRNPDADKPLAAVQLSFHYSSLLAREPEPFFCRFKLPASDLLKGVTQVVNGLACVYGIRCLFVCNVCTGEIMRLPDPLYTRKNCYYFGCDPVNGMYKLLKLNTTRTGQAVGRAVAAVAHIRRRPAVSLRGIRRQVAAVALTLAADHPSHHNLRAVLAVLDDDDDNNDEIECQILTLGRDSSWRKLAVDFRDEPLVTFNPKSSSINGVLYWGNCLFGQCTGFISFDLNQERFQLIKLPKEDQPLLGKSPKFKLAEFMGRAAVTCIVADTERRFVIYMLEDNQGNSWSRHVIPFPRGFGGRASVYTIPVGNLPSGQLLLANPRAKVLDQDSRSFTPVYAYDHEKHKFERFFVGKLPESLDLSGFRVSMSSLVEINAPLSDLFGGGEGSIN